ncbi:hypothetical protein FA15DRAFT_490702 [Coprinopsis marcescibilis]|uniref:DUF6699 domain-containing protein n=1 Tax=Coprinopsis marcescibilis TaxID=230819 RepID=A0A5C3KR97_COPMA|nr:hypothetical protein FA15DRAFT_490702 [Coprinopsis marcescibilis]
MRYKPISTILYLSGFKHSPSSLHVSATILQLNWLTAFRPETRKVSFTRSRTLPQRKRKQQLLRLRLFLALDHDMQYATPNAQGVLAGSGSTPASSSQKKPRWQQHGGFYRPVHDISQPWQPSPRISSPQPILNAPAYQVPLRANGSPATSEESGETLMSEVAVGTLIERKAKRVRRRSTLTRLKRRIIRWLDSSLELEGQVRRPWSEPPETHVRPQSSPVVSHRVQLNEWKEWGYYARPYVNGVQVYNTPSPYLNQEPILRGCPPEYIQDSDMTIQEVFTSLADSDPDPRPDRWKLGIEHPSLPPRPPRWKTPDPTEPLPFPWEVQLNPFLEHFLCGVPVMYWDVREDISACQHGIEEDPETAFSRPLLPADLAQPASWPFLTHMYINALADDISPKFKWPFMVINDQGIKVRDVINSIYDNFQQYVFEREFYSWTMTRRREATKTRILRCNPEEHPFKAMHGEIHPMDRMKRVDYLVGRTLFRGLAPNPDGTGWVLYLGQD